MTDGEPVQRAGRRPGHVEVGDAARFARSLSTSSSTSKLSAPQSSRTRSASACPARWPSPARRSPAASDVVTRDAHRDRNADRFAVLELPHIDARARDLS